MNLSKDEIRNYKLPPMADFNLSYINQNIIIEDILGEFGYKNDLNKSTSKWLRTQKDGVTLLINRKENRFIIENENTGGEAYVFLQNNLSGTYNPKPNLTPFQKRELFVIAHKLLKLPEYKNAQIKRAALKPITKNNITFKTIPLINKNFLKHRGLSNTTIVNKLFKNTIFNSKVQMPEHKGGGTITNTAFPLYDVHDFDKIKGYISRNKKYVDSQTNKIKNPRYFNGDSKSLWHSNMPDNLKNIAIAESEIDALSHFEINKPKDTLYVSFGGALSPDKTKNLNVFLEKFLKKDKNIAISSITDNDITGKLYDLEILKILLDNNQSNYNFELKKYKVPESTSYKIDLYIHTNSDKININQEWKYYVNKIDSIQKTNKESINMYTKNDVLTITFSDKINTENFNSFLQIIKNKYQDQQNVINFKTDKPKLNDWNDDLAAYNKKKTKQLKM